MSIEEELFTRLSTYPGLVPLVGTRVYPMQLPQTPTLPALTYWRVSGVRGHSHDGPSGLAEPRFQASVWAETYAGARAVATQVRLALDAWQPTGGVALLLNEVDMVDVATGWHHSALDFRVEHTE